MIDAGVIALANHLWQSTLFAVFLASLSLLLRRNGARIRYALWLAASMKFLVPLTLLTCIGSQMLGHIVADPGDLPAVVWLADDIAVPMTLMADISATPAGHAASADLLLVVLAVFWAVGAVAVGSRWLVQWSRVRQALRASTPTSLPFVVPVRLCALRLEPAVVGIVRPVLLLPQGVQQRLSPEEMSAVLDHERCHVAWRDNLAAALHMVVQVLFWFHPLIWWLGARLVDERERACDEHVLAADHMPESYAEGIIKVCELCLEVRLPCVSGIGHANLKRRIEDIVRKRLIKRMSRERKIVILAVAGVTAGVPVAVGMLVTLSARAYAQLPAATAPDFRNISVRLTAPGNRSRHCTMMLRWDRKFRVENCTLLELITTAYDVSSLQVVTGRRSTGSAFDITADVPGGVRLSAAIAQFPGMLRQVLAKRLGVVIRQERRQVNGYALGIGPGGSRLTRNANWLLGSRGVFGPDSIDLTDFPLRDLVNLISTDLGVPVADQTGLQGAYAHHYKVRWVQSAPRAVDASVLTRSLEEQLGLRIEARPVSVEMINVVSANVP